MQIILHLTITTDPASEGLAGGELCFFTADMLIIRRGPLVIQLKHCPVLPSLNKVDYYYYISLDFDSLVQS